MQSKERLPGATRRGRMNRPPAVGVAAGVLLILAFAYLGIGGIAASRLTLPQRVFDPERNPGAYDLEFEELRIPARTDKLEIAAWHIPSLANSRVIVLVHGRDNSRSSGFVDQFVPFASALHDAGFSVFMIDLRGHGQSADSRYTFGIRERRDILGAVDWLETHGYGLGSIGVLGYSLGAASVIGAASEETDVGAIWIDSAYADMRSVIEGSWTQESGLPLVFLSSTELMTRLLYGYDLAASRPVDEIAGIAPRPIYMVHCREDRLIPLSHMDRLLSVSANTQTWVIPNCDQHALDHDIVPEKYNNHAIGYSLNSDEYTGRVIAFFDAVLR